MEVDVVEGEKERFEEKLVARTNLVALTWHHPSNPAWCMRFPIAEMRSFSEAIFVYKANDRIGEEKKRTTRHRIKEEDKLEGQALMRLSGLIVKNGRPLRLAKRRCTVSSFVLRFGVLLGIWRSSQ